MCVELLGLTLDRIDVGDQLIGVHRKGTGRLQRLPGVTGTPSCGGGSTRPRSSPGRRDARVVDRRAPLLPLIVPAMRRRVPAAQTTLWAPAGRCTICATRAARRLIADPAMSLTDVQWVLGHAHLSTTTVYLRPDDDEMIGKVHASPPSPPGAVDAACQRAGIRPEVLETLLGWPVRGR